VTYVCLTFHDAAGEQIGQLTLESGRIGWNGPGEVIAERFSRDHPVIEMAGTEGLHAAKIVIRAGPQEIVTQQRSSKGFITNQLNYHE
jgi:hypothetical protein